MLTQYKHVANPPIAKADGLPCYRIVNLQKQDSLNRYILISMCMWAFFCNYKFNAARIPWYE